MIKLMCDNYFRITDIPSGPIGLVVMGDDLLTFMSV
jgi:hypothetical protein